MDNMIQNMRHNFIPSVHKSARFAAAALVLAFLLLAVPAALAMPALSQGALTLGDSGKDAEIIQAELKSLGIYGGDVTGIYDAKTAEAVKLLQTILGVKANGIFNTATLNAYNNALSKGILKPKVIEPVPEEHGILWGIVIGIDPGHQEVPDMDLEYIIPGGDRVKPRQSPGGVGVKTGTPEHRITLSIALRLKKLLENSHATVIISRDRSDVMLSNRERADIMNSANVDIWIRLHCDSSVSGKVHGTSVLIPAEEYTPLIYKASAELGRHVLARFCEATGADALPVQILSNQAGFNWSQSPVIVIEMGFLSNSAEDLKLNLDSYQKLCALGIYNGILAYFEEK